MTSIALVTCAEIPDLDHEGALLREALTAAGQRAQAAVWSDPEVDWASFDRVVVRSTWDYTRRRGEFLAWARRVDSLTRLDNSAGLLEWNSDKHYLAHLAEAGIPVVPTAFIEPGTGGHDISHPFDQVEHVVKPAVGAGSLDTARHQPGGQSGAHITRLLNAGRSVITQPYLAEVDTAGETALIYLGGVFSHALRKDAILVPAQQEANELFVPERMSPREPGVAERDLAESLLSALPAVLADRGVACDGPPLYARIDLLPTPDGPLLLELELTEPSLFLDHAPGSTERFVAAITGG